MNDRDIIMKHYKLNIKVKTFQMFTNDGRRCVRVFENHQVIKRKLQTINDVGLNYITLGQSATSLSGGEAHVKLASELYKRITEKHFIF